MSLLEWKRYSTFAIEQSQDQFRESRNLISNEFDDKQVFIFFLFFSNSDFEMILMSQNMNLQSAEVKNAIVSAGIAADAQTVTYAEYSKAILRLESLIRKPAPKDDLPPACESVVLHAGAQKGEVSLDMLNKVFEASGKGVLTEVQFRRMMEALRKDSDGTIDLLSLTTQL